MSSQMYSSIAVQPPNVKYQPQVNVYDDSCLHLEYRRYFFTVNGTSITLTRTEFRILSRLIRGINGIVVFEELWEVGWGPGSAVNRKNLHVLVSKIRRKLEPVGVRINNVVGVGYILSHGACCQKAKTAT